MADSKNMLANSVSSAGQVAEDKYVRIFRRGGAKRVLFFGNSITLHAPKEDIGWYGNWGMAASAEDKDYVHTVLRALDEKYGAVDYCTVHGAEWERGYQSTDTLLDELYKPARDFAADIVIIRIGENISTEAHEAQSCKHALDKVIAYFSHAAERVIVTDLFWNSSKNSVFSEVAEERGYTFVHLTDLEQDDRNMAKGLFWHEGVAAHPGDLGMKCIAERIIAAL